jgi:hypothetical protein
MSDFISLGLSLIGFGIFFFAYIWLAENMKKCPPNTIIIIDRDTHYFKTVHAGYYTLNKKKDMVTSVISEKVTTQRYNNIFMTHEGKYYEIDFSVSYKCESIDAVQNALQDSRRSIYDIINNAMSIAIKSFTAKDFASVNQDRTTAAIYSQIERMLEPFYIDFQKLYIDRITLEDSAYGEQNVFKKHESQGQSPIS